MGNLLERKELVESFSAVKSFLQSAGISPTQHHIDLIFKVNIKGQTYNHKFEIECKDLINKVSFIINSDVFKANGYYTQVWSAYNLFSFNENTQELSFQLDENKYTLKHLL
jgi:hypothetical protein